MQEDESNHFLEGTFGVLWDGSAVITSYVQMKYNSREPAL